MLRRHVHPASGDLRNPLLVDDGAIEDPEVVRLMRIVDFRTVAGDPDKLGGSIRMTISGRPVALDASDYPGLPSAQGYAASVSDKFDRVLAALQLDGHGPALRRAVDGIAEGGGPARLRAALLQAGRAAVR